MLGWIVRIFFILAAPITTLLVSRDVLNFDLIQTFVAIILMVAFVGFIAVLSARWQRARP
jgi:hypothetical protein